MKFLALITLCFALSACGNKTINKSVPYEDPQGLREFQINNSLSAFRVTLTGVISGTPDREVIWSVIENAHNSGKIDLIVELMQPTEGGLNHCIVINNEANRNLLLKELQNVQTSVKDSNYIISSQSGCN